MTLFFASLALSGIFQTVVIALVSLLLYSLLMKEAPTMKQVVLVLIGLIGFNAVIVAMLFATGNSNILINIGPVQAILFAAIDISIGIVISRAVSAKKKP